MKDTKDMSYGEMMALEDKEADDRGVHRPFCFTELGGSCNCGFDKRQAEQQGVTR